MGFHRALEKVLKHEGGYSNNPADSGGETFKGISRVWYPKWGGWAIVDSYDDKDLLVDDSYLQGLVEDFYYTFYWYKLKCDQIEDEFVAMMVFNFAVNLGKRQVVKKIQRILGTKPDGIIGQKTLGALNATDGKCFTHHFLLEIVEFYTQVAKKGSNHLFFKGWINRAMSTYYDSERFYK